MKPEGEPTTGQSDGIMHPYYGELGPFYDSTGAAHQLGGLTEHELADRREAGRVLAGQTGDGAWLYPAWQFDGRGSVREQLEAVLTAMRGLNGWLIARWLMNPHSGLGGRTPREALREGYDALSVATLASEDRALMLS